MWSELESSFFLLLFLFNSEFMFWNSFVLSCNLCISLLGNALISSDFFLGKIKQLKGIYDEKVKIICKKKCLELIFDTQLQDDRSDMKRFPVRVYMIAKHYLFRDYFRQTLSGIKLSLVPQALGSNK